MKKYDELKVFCKNTNEYLNMDGGEALIDLYETIKREMAQPSFLVEHAAGRITKAILAEYPKAQSVRIRLLKENPPMGADCQGAGVELVMYRE